jgi:hypothetical protein
LGVSLAVCLHGSFEALVVSFVFGILKNEEGFQLFLVEFSEEAFLFGRVI